MNHSRTSGDSRSRGKRLRKVYSYLHILRGRVKSDLNRSSGKSAQRRSDAVVRADSANGEQPARAGVHPGGDEVVTAKKLSVVGPTTIECFAREPRGPIARFELSGPNGEMISFPIRCGLFAAGGDHA